MKPRHLLLFLCLLASVPCLRAASAPDRFERTKARVDALLNHRLKPPPLPEKPANPFVFTGTSALFAVNGAPPNTPTTSGPVVPAQPVVPDPIPNVAMTDDQILAFCVARLRIGGLVQRGERSHLLINSSTYKEGDLIPVRASSEVVYYVKVIRIATNEVVFGYNDAFYSLPLKT
ncbi:MAG TPA: hypothetical protein VG734_22190 [Lacunisphaera sp.]|nr:hypothetical protein [Lacunisphaera sp.]